MINYSILNIIVGFFFSSDEKSKVRFTSSSCGDFDQENKLRLIVHTNEKQMDERHRTTEGNQASHAFIMLFY